MNSSSSISRLRSAFEWMSLKGEQQLLEWSLLAGEVAKDQVIYCRKGRIANFKPYRMTGKGCI